MLWAEFVVFGRKHSISLSTPALNDAGPTPPVLPHLPPSSSLFSHQINIVKPTCDSSSAAQQDDGQNYTRNEPVRQSLTIFPFPASIAVADCHLIAESTPRAYTAWVRTTWAHPATVVEAVGWIAGTCAIHTANSVPKTRISSSAIAFPRTCLERQSPTRLTEANPIQLANTMPTVQIPCPFNPKSVKCQTGTNV